MKPTTRGVGLSICIGIIVMSFGLSGCGNDDSDDNSKDRRASLSVELDFASPVGPPSTLREDKFLGEPDICIDYNIDTITVRVHRAADNSEAASAQKDCSLHELTVANVPVDENLYVVCAGSMGRKTVWQGQKSGIVAKAGQNTNVGKIRMSYVGTDTAAPEIASTFPPGDAADVDLGAWIVLTFNEPLAPSSIPDNAITVLSGDIPVAGRISYDPAFYSIRFEPESALDPETTYKATLEIEKADGSKITDIAGQPFADIEQWQFSTRGATDATAPQIIAVSPAGGAEDVAPQTAVSVQFSEPMDPATMTATVLQLSSGPDAVQGRLAYDEQSRTLIFTPEQELNALALYSAIVSVQARDTAQNALQEPHTWQFKTMANGERFDLNVKKEGSGSGTVVSTPAAINCGIACQAAIDLNTVVTLEAQPEENAIFTGWSGGVCDGTTGPCIFDMKADTIITAHFSLANYTIDVSTIPENGSGGAVSPGNSDVIHGNDISFDIEANPYYHLEALTVDENTVHLTDTYVFENVTADHSLQAEFKTNTILLTDNDVSDLHLHPNGRMVWLSQQMSGDRDVYSCDGSMPPIPQKIADTPDVDEYHPQINADGQMVWSGSEESDFEVYFWDESTPDPINISNNPDGRDQYQQINGAGVVVWGRQNGSDWDIYYWDGSMPPNPINISNHPDGYDYRPQVNRAGGVVWYGESDSGTQIYYYNLSTSSGPVNISNTVDVYNKNPKINSAGQVVWAGRSDSQWEIYYWDGSMPPNPVNISNNPDVDDYEAEINSKGHVVWSSGSDANSEIFHWDGSMPPKPVNISNNPDCVDDQPEINSAGHVAWLGQKVSETGIYYDAAIYYWDGSMPPKPIDISNSPSLIHYSHQIDDAGRVAWLSREPGLDKPGKIYLNLPKR